MYIEKIFSSDSDNLYLVVLSSSEMKVFSDYLEKLYATAGTLYDQTDRIKQMKDSDILAEQKKSNTGSYVLAGRNAAFGAAAGGALGSVAGGLMGLKKGGISGLAKGIQKGAQTGAILGGSTGGLGTLASGRDERNLNRQYNKRLGQAQKQSLRREAADWKNNITNREGYTY